ERAAVVGVDLGDAGDEVVVGRRGRDHRERAVERLVGGGGSARRYALGVEDVEAAVGGGHLGGRVPGGGDPADVRKAADIEDIHAVLAGVGHVDSLPVGAEGEVVG